MDKNNGTYQNREEDDYNGPKGVMDDMMVKVGL